MSKNPRFTSYAPRKFRPYALPALFIRMLLYVSGHWPLALIALFFLSPVGPHLRIQYSYQDYGGGRFMTSCTYLGSRGMIEWTRGRCPVVAIIDARQPAQP